MISKNKNKMNKNHQTNNHPISQPHGKVLGESGKHIPVMADQVVKHLNPQKGESYLDLTAGYGGHARAILGRTLQTSKAMLVDRDSSAVTELKAQFSRSNVRIVHSDYYSQSQKLYEYNERFDLILADLGVSSLHFDDAARGFSFSNSGPLDMRMDNRQKLSAADIVNGYSQNDLADLIKAYGQEPRASTIARLIVQERPFSNTEELAGAIKKSLKTRPSRIHPATRTFQALRIAVNDEINQLAKSLPIWMDLLAPGGRLAIISFHSLEDRLVKRAFKQASDGTYDSQIILLTKKPVVPDADEIVNNPRSRSAKLRAVAKIKTGRSRNANTGKKPLQNL